MRALVISSIKHHVGYARMHAYTSAHLRINDVAFFDERDLFCPYLLLQHRAMAHGKLVASNAVSAPAASSDASGTHGAANSLADGKFDGPRAGNDGHGATKIMVDMPRSKAMEVCSMK